MSALLESLRWRYATKKFDPTKKLTDNQLNELLEALRLSSSSYGLQPWKFIVVTDPALRKTLRTHSWDQSQVTDASHLIVLCAKDVLTEADVLQYVDEIAKTRNVSVESLAGYRDMMLGSIKRQTPEQLSAWNDKQVYLALGTLLAACAHEQIDACPMEGFDAAQYTSVLGLKGMHATVVCPVGFRAADDAAANYAKVRFPMELVVERR